MLSCKSNFILTNLNIYKLIQSLNFYIFYDSIYLLVVKLRTQDKKGEYLIDKVESANSCLN